MKLLKQKFKDMGATYTEIAEVVGVSGKQAVGNWVSNESMPAYAAIKIARHYNVSLDWLFDLTVSRHSVSEPKAEYIVEGNINKDLNVQLLVDILNSGDVNEKAFNDLVKAFTNIIQLVCDVEDYTNSHQGDRRSKSRPFWHNKRQQTG